MSGECLTSRWLGEGVVSLYELFGRANQLIGAIDLLVTAFAHAGEHAKNSALRVC